MTEKFINDMIETLENMDGDHHVLFAFCFNFTYFILLCIVHDLPGIETCFF